MEYTYYSLRWLPCTHRTHVHLQRSQIAMLDEFYRSAAFQMAIGHIQKDTRMEPVAGIEVYQRHPHARSTGRGFMTSPLSFDCRPRVRENSTVDTLPEFAGLGRVEQSFTEGVCDCLAGHLRPLVDRKSVEDRALYGRDRHPFMDVDLIL
jgi:hypothetical protein